MTKIYLIAGAAFLLCLFFAVFYLLNKRSQTRAAESLLSQQGEKPKILRSLLPLFGAKLEQKTLLQLEEKLVQADIDLESCRQIIQSVQKEKSLTSQSLQTAFLQVLGEDNQEKCKLNLSANPAAMMFVGVNGVGKTSTVGKLACKLQQEGKSVCLVPADTFRAGAVEQLKIWSKRAGCECIDAKMGEDPAAVVYRAIEQALKKKTQVILIDTAGRLHNNSDLMAQLKKITKIAKKLLPNGIDETIVVLDGCLGQNSLRQLQEFDKICCLSGVAITKLDGSAKGGVVFGIQQKFEVPVKLVGTGEKKEDIDFFEVKKYVQKLV